MNLFTSLIAGMITVGALGTTVDQRSSEPHSLEAKAPVPDASDIGFLLADDPITSHVVLISASSSLHAEVKGKSRVQARSDRHASHYPTRATVFGKDAAGVYHVRVYCRDRTGAMEPNTDLRGNVTEDGIATCYWDGQPYSTGGVVCHEGKKYHCTSNGSWQYKGYQCD